MGNLLSPGEYAEQRAKLKEVEEAQARAHLQVQGSAVADKIMSHVLANGYEKGLHINRISGFTPEMVRAGATLMREKGWYVHVHRINILTDIFWHGWKGRYCNGYWIRVKPLKKR